MNKPFETYPGGKNSSGVYQTIINKITPHDLYIELFLGNGSIMAKLAPSTYQIGIDIDLSVINEWLKVNLEVDLSRFLLNANAIDFIESFLPTASILKNLGVRIFIFCDPPYLMETRKKQDDIYTYEMTERDHIRFLAAISRLMPFANILISHYSCNLYNDVLVNWYKQDFSNNTRAGRVTDRLYWNYEVKELHDYSFLGENYREREKIKGMLTNTVSKIERMPDLQRAAFINTLKSLNLF